MRTTRSVPGPSRQGAAGADTLPAVQALLTAFGVQDAQLCIQRTGGAQALAAYRPFSCADPDMLWGLYLD